MKYLLLVFLWVATLWMLGHKRLAEGEDSRADDFVVLRPTPTGYERFNGFVTFGPRNPLGAPKRPNRYGQSLER